MTLKLCPINDKNKVTTEECFDQYPLYLADDNSTFSYVIPGKKLIKTRSAEMSG
jgi:hypothetical protein